MVRIHFPPAVSKLRTSLRNLTVGDGRCGSTRRPDFRSPNGPAFCAITSASRERSFGPISPEDLVQHLPPPETLPPGVDPPRPISVTFIPASVFDNPALLQVNPGYLAWLLSLPLLESERLLGGNWKIRPAAELYFKREWCAVVDEVPADLDIVRYWDLAATEKTELNDPDWTAPAGTRRAHDHGRVRS